MEKQKFLNKLTKEQLSKYDYSLVPNNFHILDKLKIICNSIDEFGNKHGIFEQTAHNHCHKKGCPKCANKNITTKTFIQRAKQIFPEYNYSKTIYSGSRNYLKIICPIHGEFECIASSILSKHGCPKCGLIKQGISITLSNKKFIEEVQKIHFKIRTKYNLPDYDYSKINYIKSNKFINVICPIHGEFEILANSFQQGNGCKSCGIIIQAINNTKTEEQFIKKAQQVHQNSNGTPKYNYSKTIYTNAKDKCIIICPEHGEFKQSPNSHLRGSGCPKCSNIKQNSKFELEIQEFLNQNNIEFEINNRIKIYPQELDIYIPSLKIGIEFNGLYWHSEINKSNNYHLEKTEACEKQGIHLIHIFEDEWIYKSDIIKSRLINLFNKNKWKIYARNCKIKQVPIEQEKVFLQNNHIQGYISSQICYGLYYINPSNNKEYLVSLMSFGGMRKNLGSFQEKDCYELYRFVNAKNFTIIGAASKLFKHFINKFKPKQIISFADRRWSIKSSKNLYEQLGFEFDSYTKPGYFYIQGNKRINRFGLRKDILISKYGCPKEMSEHEFCEQQGWFRIYDCGQLRYIWKTKN